MFLLFSAVILFNLPGLLFPRENTAPKYRFTELFTIGTKESDSEEKTDDPYLFYMITSIDCDKDQNIYVLDYQAINVKKFDHCGKYITTYFSAGKGPQELANPYEVSINQYTGHMFILQDFGLTMKEFDQEVKELRYFKLPQQFFGYFFFLNAEEFVYLNAVPYSKQFHNFKIANVVQKKILKEFAPVEMDSDINYKQIFSVSENLVLWTSRGNDMTLLAFDLKTGNQIEEIRIPGNFKKNKMMTTPGSGDQTMYIPILYNVAQPFVIDKQLFVLVIIQEYEEKDGKINHFPVKWKRILYQVNGANFVNLGELKDCEDLFYGNVSKNRLFLYSNEPYGRIRVFEFNKR